jgi:hypothetical protein
MRDAARFKKYAEECRRFAKTMPAEHQSTLNEIADAWLKCAEDAERKEKHDTDEEASEKSGPEKPIKPPQHRAA